MAAAKNKTPVKVEYTRYPGIVTRIIERSDWERLGQDFDTIEFSVAEGYAKDATDWPEGVVEYFKTDDEFTVTSGETVEETSGDPGTSDPSAPAGPPSGANG